MLQIRPSKSEFRSSDAHFVIFWIFAGSGVPTAHVVSPQHMWCPHSTCGVVAPDYDSAQPHVCCGHTYNLGTIVNMDIDGTDFALFFDVFQQIRLEKLVPVSSWI